MAPGRRLIAAALAAAFYSSCGGNQPANPSRTTPVAPSSYLSNIDGHLDVAVVVDPDAREYSETDIRRVVGVANDKLRSLTNETLAVTEGRLSMAWTPWGWPPRTPVR